MMKIKRFLNINRYGIFIFAGLMIRMLINMPYKAEALDDPFAYIFYIVDYKTAGFVPRALIGSFFALFSRRMTLRTLYLLAVVVTLLLIFTVSMLINRVFKHEFEGKTALFLIVCTFLLLSNENFYLFDTFHFGMVDTYFILLTLLIVCLAGHKILRWFIPVICFCCMAIYEGYVFAFMAVVGIVLIYYCFKEKSVSAVTVLVLSCVVVAGSFVYFYVLFRADHLNMLKYGTFEELEQVLSRRTDAEISQIIAELYYYNSSMTLFTDGRWNVAEVLEETSAVRRQCLPTAIVFCSMPVYVWLGALKNDVDKKRRFIWLLCLIAPLASVPFLAFTEQMKYISYVIFSQLILLMLFVGKEKAVQQPLVRAEKLLDQKPFLICIPWGLMMLFRSIW